MRATQTPSSSLCRAAVALFRSLAHDLFDSYRPERHYMRGPGPKWHEKHVIVPVEFTAEMAFNKAA